MSGVRTHTQSLAAASAAPPLSPGDLEVFLLPCVTLQVFEDSCQPLQDRLLWSWLSGSWKAVCSIVPFLVTFSWWILPHQCFSSVTPTGQTLPNRQGAVKLLK